MSSSSLRSKRVLITGAGSGIGYQLALAFARAGVNIIATDISLDGLGKLKPEVEALGVECRTELLDVVDVDAFTALADQLAADKQFPDILVNNAGLGLAKPFMDTERKDWDLMFSVNVFGLINGSKVFVRRWLDGGVAAHLVNVSSSVAFGAIANMSAYAASKSAVYGLTEALACELADTNICVTTVCPGAINTNITKREGAAVMSDKADELVKKYYEEHGTNPAVVAAAIVAGVMKNKAVVVVGAGARSLDIARRILPSSYFRKLVISTARKLGFLEAKGA